jgi:hypothetical protein
MPAIGEGDEPLGRALVQEFLALRGPPRLGLYRGSPVIQYVSLARAHAFPGLQCYWTVPRCVLGIWLHPAFRLKPASLQLNLGSGKDIGGGLAHVPGPSLPEPFHKA